MWGQIIGGVASIGGSILGAKAQDKAIEKAIAAQEQAAKVNNRLATGIYHQNAARLDPYSFNGTQAGNAINALLLGTSAAQAAPAAITDDAKVAWLLANSTNAKEAIERMGGATAAEKAAAGAAAMQGTSKQEAYKGWLASQQSVYSPTNGGVGGAQGTTGGTNPAQAAFDQFRNSTNYQWRLNEGLNALNNGYAANGMLESGAAVRGITNFGQNMAANALGEYLDRLYQQQGVGMQAASSLAGVGQNFVSNISGNNQNAANAQSNGALAAGQNKANMWGSIGNALGQAAGGMFGSSYGFGR